MPSPVDTESRYQALIQAIDAGYCLLEVEFDAANEPVDYRFLETNALFEPHTGLRNAVGRTAREVLPNIERVWIERYGQVALSREPIHFEQRSDVMGRVFDVHAFPVGAPDSRLVGLLFTDVTRERQHEANRKFLADVARTFESDASLDEIMGSIGERLGSFLGFSSCLFCEVDEAADTITTSFGWTRAGEPNLIRTFRISEYLSPVFFSESRARRTVTVEDTATDTRTDTQAYASLNIRAFVTVPYFSEGEWTHFFAVTDAAPRVWTGAELDMLESFARLVFSKLERAQSDLQIRESEARFRAMADAVPQIVWITDAQGRVEFFNRQWMTYTGLPHVPDTAADVAAAAMHPDDISETMARFQAATESGEPFHVEHRIRSASGEYRWFLVRAEPELHRLTGRPCRWYGASVDIHDRWMAERALAETDRRKDEFLATLAHELRNPLAPIRTGLSVLDLEPTPEAAARTRQVMRRQLAHMVRLIDDLLDISRINSNKIELQREPLDLRSVIEEAIEANRSAIDAGAHRLFVSLPAKPLTVDADRTRLVQVVGNLLNNAAKYTPHRGRIEVSAEHMDGHACVSVQDTGVGIEPAALAGVFDMFSQIPGQAHRAQGGLGIGLSLVKRLVEMHGGSVVAESGGPETGARFVVRLPLSQMSAVMESALGAVPMPTTRRSLDVLVLDDNVDAAEMMKAVLEAGGHRVHVAHSGPEALALAADHRLDVAFLDIGLPGMDGYEVATSLRRLTATHSPTLVALTGWGADADRRRAFAAGFDHHLTKPVDAQPVNALLASLADGQ